MTRYREAIRADLAHEYNVDLTVLWRERRFVALLDLVDQLPATSRLRAAVASDRDLALEMLEQGGPKGEQEPWSPPLTEWDVKSALLAEVRDRLGEVLKVLASIKSGVPVVQQERLRTPPKMTVKPFPRPVTAWEQMRDDQARAAAQWLVDTFFPHAGRQDGEG